MSDNKELDIFAMMAQAQEETPDGSDIFGKPDPKPEVVKQVIRKEPEPWSPDFETLKDLGMDNNPKGAVYHKDEVKLKEETKLKHIIDDEIGEQSQEAMDELDRIAYNLERAKKRLGIRHMSIPEEHNAQLITLAADKESFETLVATLDHITKDFPDTIIERTDDSPKTYNTELESMLLEDSASEEAIPEAESQETKTSGVSESKVADNNSVVNIIIDKRNVSEVSFDQEDIDKIKKARMVELRIVEEKNTTFTILDDDSKTPLDNILSQYERKVGDFPLTLPASHYRCTLTGLSYPEVLDLSYTYDMTSLDSELKKWTIVYNHIKNPSIGKFTGWIDPDGTEHTAFEDFQRKTSFLDLNILLWGILCATTFNDEVITINCGAQNCGSTHEWIYHPRELIDMDSVPVETLEEIRLTGEASSEDEIFNQFNSSCLNQKRFVTLADSGYVIAMGHSNVTRYMRNVFAHIMDLRDKQDSDFTDVFASSALAIVDHILVPKKDSEGNFIGYTKVSKIENIIQLLKTLNEVDTMSVTELIADISEPYQFSFTLKNIICPKCRGKSVIRIEDMSQMLFILARSLQAVSVELKRY